MAADQTGDMSVPPDPPTYDDRLIRRLRPPEVEGLEGEWNSRWLLRFASAPEDEVLSALANDLTITQGAGDLTFVILKDEQVRMELTSEVHPLDPEAYPLIDRVLKAVDRTAGGLVEINGSPRDWWRTFRAGSGTG